MSVTVRVEPAKPKLRNTPSNVAVSTAEKQSQGLSILVNLCDALRQAQTMADVSIAAGIARQELLDLASEGVDRTGELFETPLD